MTEIKLELDHACELCSGTGRTPDWMNPPPSPLSDREWYLRRVRRDIDRAPPEPVDCPECKGKGCVLTPMGEQVLSFVIRWLDATDRSDMARSMLTFRPGVIWED